MLWKPQPKSNDHHKMTIGQTIFHLPCLIKLHCTTVSLTRPATLTSKPTTLITSINHSKAIHLLIQSPTKISSPSSNHTITGHIPVTSYPSPIPSSSRCSKITSCNYQEISVDLNKQNLNNQLKGSKNNPQDNQQENTFKPAQSQSSSSMLAVCYQNTRSFMLSLVKSSLISSQ